MTPIILESPTPPSPSPSVGVDREGLLLDGLDLNDGATRTLVGLTFTPAKKLLEWIKGADADGSKLLRMARHENSQFELRLWLRNSTRDGVLDTAGEIIDKLQEAERQAAGALGRGLALVWTPAGSSYSFTFYVLAGESDLDRAADFYKLGKPYFDVVLSTSPFGYGPEVTNVATVTSSLPLITLEVEDVPGDVPAEARFTITDDATQPRDFVVIGLEQFFYDSGTVLLNKTDAMVYTGFAGTPQTRSGSYSSPSVIRATLTTTPVAVCSSLEMEHVGTFHNYFRLWPSSTDVMVRLAWRQGRDQWTTELWRQAPFEDAFWEVDLGLSRIRAAQLGTQTWQWRLEAKSATAGETVDVDVHEMIPADPFGTARVTPIVETATSFTDYDTFDQSAGGLAAKTSGGGQTWAGAGDADDFAVEATGHTAQRTAVSDADANTGRYGISGATALTAQHVQVDHKRTVYVGPSAEILTSGVLARYADTSNYLLAAVEVTNTGSAEASYLVVKKRVAGTVTELARIGLGPADGVRSTTSSQSWWVNTYYSIAASVDVAGRWFVWWWPTGGIPDLIASGQDSALATGGALASGKPGIYDAKLGAVAVTRNYDNFLAFAPARDAVVFSGQSAEFRSYGDDPVLREDSTGTYWGRPPESRGGRLWLPCAGDQGRTSRVALMVRRSDVEALPSANLTDSTTLAVSYTPRWLAVPRQ